MLEFCQMPRRSGPRRHAPPSSANSAAGRSVAGGAGTVYARVGGTGGGRGDRAASTVRNDPTLLRQLNERSVFEVVRARGPISRAEVARCAGISAPTASKVVANLLDAGLLEQIGSAQSDRAGRPGKLYRVATDKVQVLGAVIDVRKCCIVSAGLDGQIDAAACSEFPTPRTYEQLIDALARGGKELSSRPKMATLGVGISTPGELDPRNQRVIQSPNLHILDGRSPSADLHERLGIEAVMFHETVGTCLAEQAYGAARGMTDFVMIGTYEGFGVSIVSGGRLIQGKDGMAGEMGHITVNLNGERCGCGNAGCLETVATDPAFARAVSRRAGRRMEVEDIVRRAARGQLDVSHELDTALDYLAVGIAAAINIFNPQAVLVCSRMLDVYPDAFDRLKARVARRALAPLAGTCEVVRAEGNTRQGAIAAILHHLTHSLGPSLH